MSVRDLGRKNPEPKAKTVSRRQVRKVPSKKRTKKWNSIYYKALKEYHTWIKKQLKKQNNKNKVKKRDRKRGD